MLGFKPLPVEAVKVVDPHVRISEVPFLPFKDNERGVYDTELLVMQMLYPFLLIGSIANKLSLLFN